MNLRNNPELTGTYLREIASCPFCNVNGLDAWGAGTANAALNRKEAHKNLASIIKLKIVRKDQERAKIEGRWRRRPE